MTFRVERGEDHSFQLIGELDVATADHLYRQVGGTLKDGRDVRLDLSRLTFIDSSGLHMLVKLCKGLQNGGRVVIERPTDAVVKVFDIVGADQFPNLEIQDITSPAG
jgi:anti-sigma B factor antagonist